MNIKSITCPSCGSSLNADENETRVVCSFCGSSVIVEDTRQEGYNFELGSMQARANAALDISNKVNELMGPLCDYERVNSEKELLEKQKKSLLKQTSIFEKHGKAISIVAGVLITLLLFAIMILVKASFVGYLVCAVIAAIAFFASRLIVNKYLKNVKKGAEDTELAIVAHAKTIDSFNNVMNKYKDIVIPAKYRNIKAMTYIRDSLKSQQAQTIEQAMYQYDDILRQEETIALQQEQIRLQNEQLNQAETANNKGLISSGSKKTQETKKSTGLFGTSGKSATVVNKKKTIVVKQHGHSITFHLLLCCFGIGFITIPYYTLSKRHYWHL